VKSMKYFPFERNRYFYGKLLSVDDFDTEQRYVNDKRRMINRFIHGCGVVCGMNVIAVDDSTVSIEKGFALDFCGREIVLDTPVTKKLAMLDGFDNYNDQERSGSHLYLCVEYEETEKEPVHSITNSTFNGTDGAQHNKYAEGYHLYLSTEEPQNDVLSEERFYESSKVVYSGNRIRVRQVLPRYAGSNAPFQMKVIVENLGQTKPFSFKYKLGLTCVQGADGDNGGKAPDTVDIVFDESQYEKAGSYTLTIPLKATAVRDIDGQVGVEEGSFSLTIGGRKAEAAAKSSQTVRIIEGDITQAIIQNYYQTAMEDIAKNSYQQGIYLARIAVIKAGTSYVIDEVEPMPFKQYILSNPLASVITSLLLKEEEGRGRIIQKEAGAGKMLPGSGAGHMQGQIAAGTAILDLGIGGTVGQRFFSQEIVHGLGLGTVNIVLGEATGLGEDSSIIFGAQDIFDAPEGHVRTELAARADVQKGSFVIGMKCLELTGVRQVKVHWMAVKDNSRVVYEREQDTMNIKPDLLNLFICENHYFEAVVGKEAQSRVTWRIKEEGGGTIDENGMYTAPNKPGVFEVIAESMDHPEMKASAFVVVRDV